MPRHDYHNKSLKTKENKRSWKQLEKMNTLPYRAKREWHNFFLFFKKYFIYLFVERGEGKEREGEKHQCVVAPPPHPPLGTWPAT